MKSGKCNFAPYRIPCGKVDNTFTYTLFTGLNNYFCPLGYTEFDEKGVCPDPKNANKYTLSQMVAATSNFAEANLIGEGGFGLVYKGQLVCGQVVTFFYYWIIVLTQPIPNFK